jgi:hypothetical protein
MFRCYVVGTSAVLRFFHGLTQTLEGNGWIVSGLGHERFLCNPFIFAVHQSCTIRRYKANDTDSVVK